MNVKDFEYVVEIARHHSITKAANQLYISQPTLSKFLQRLELELGTPLFHRMGKNLVPTPAGQCFIEKAQSILNLHNQMTSEIHNIATHKSGSIHLGLPASRGRHFITSIVPDFTKQFPYVKLTIELFTTADLVKRLEQGEYDMLLINSRRRSPTLSYRIVGEERMILAVPSGSSLIPLAEPRDGYPYPFVETEHWRNQPFVLSGEGLQSGGYARQLFADLNISPPIVLEIKSLDQVILAVTQGIGNTIIPSVPHGFKSHRPAYLSIENENKPIDVAIVTQQGKVLSAAETALIEIIGKKYASASK